jgi:hypothetical protein
MKNPNDSFWTTHSDLADHCDIVTIVTEAEQKLLLDRRLVQNVWRGWRIFNRRARA